MRKKVILISLIIGLILIIISYYSISFFQSKAVGFILNNKFEAHSIVVDEQEIEIFYEGENTFPEDSLFKTYESISKVEKDWFPSLEESKTPSIYLLNADSKYHSIIFKNEEIDEEIGLYSINNNAIFLDSSVSESEFNRAFAHEYAHFLFNQLLKQNDIDSELFPLWFHEGVSNAFEWTINNKLPTSVWNFDATEFDQLNTQNDENTRTLYSQGYYAVIDLINSFDMDIIEKIIVRTGEMNDFEKAFSKETQINLSEYHKKFEYDPKIMEDLVKASSDNPNSFISSAEEFLSDRADMNQYSEDLDYLLLQAYDSVGNTDKIPYYAQLASSISTNPIELLNIAKIVATYSTIDAEKIINEAIKLSEEKGFSTESLKKEADTILNN